MRKRVVIIGGGFAGLQAARALARAPVEVTLVDRQLVHIFQPLLYQVATGSLSAESIVAPLRPLFRRQRNCTCLQAEVAGIDPDGQRVETDRGPLSYDYLVVAAGAQTSYFGNDHWARYCWSLKDVDDALALRRQILGRFEAAEWAESAEAQRRLLQFVIVGGGPTGVEMAGAISELAHWVLPREHRRCDPRLAEILLVEAAPTVLGPFPDQLQERALADLRTMGIDVRLDSPVTDISANRVTWREGTETRSRDALVIWAAGVAATPLTRQLAEATGAAVDKAGRVTVDQYLRLPQRPEIFPVGDCVALEDARGKQVPGIAPAAIQQGRHVGRQIRRLVAGKAPAPFRYRDKGMLATVGRKFAVGLIGTRWRISGRLAWWLWLFVHLMYLVGFENRLVVLLRWAYSYLGRGRHARLLLRQTESIDQSS